VKIYNSLKNKKEEFKPLKDNEVRIYACGITAYDECHLGHLRSALVFDVIRNFLKYKGYKVKFVKNITDVDDKIIDKARNLMSDDKNPYKDLNEAARDISEKYTQRYYDDMEAFNIRPADIEPKATEHIGDMIAIIETLIDKGHAYEVDGDVYFSVNSFKSYGELSNQNIDNMKEGARIHPGENKRDALDFALWKKAKEEEPYWESPWGKGRPGWHIECSAMSGKYLGKTFDIHGGGLDLIFPHHENERAQSEAATGKPFAKFWIHNGLLTINGEKMAKSLGNFITLKDALAKYKDPNLIRIAMLSAHYRHPMDFSDKAIQEAIAQLDRFKNFFSFVDDTIKKHDRDFSNLPITKDSKTFKKDTSEFKDKFINAMLDDFNTAAALGELFLLIVYVYKNGNTILKDPGCAEYVKDIVSELLSIFGVSISVSTKVSDDIQAMIDEREAARKAKDFEKSDKIRDRLKAKGIVLKDTKDGTIVQKT